MRHVHIKPVENDLGVLVLAIIFIATTHFDGVHVYGSELSRFTLLKLHRLRSVEHC